jgi:dihydroorotate dehydrogenase
VRSTFLKAHPTPNVFFCANDTPLFEVQREIPDVLVGEASKQFNPEFGMMNRFGIPSPYPQLWQAEFKAATDALGSGQLLILSVTATAEPTTPYVAYRDDWKKVTDLAVEAGAAIVELNLSCPNCADCKDCLCHDATKVREICRMIHDDHPKLKLILKIGYLEQEHLRPLVLETAEIVDGYAAINSVSALAFRDGQHGKEAAYGAGVKVGISGRPIFTLGIDTVQRLARIRSEAGLGRKVIVGMGGITAPSDVKAYLDSGADFVQCTTALYIDSYFGYKVQDLFNKEIKAHQLRQRLSLEEEQNIATGNWTKAWSEYKNSVQESSRPSDAALRVLDEVALDVLNKWKNSHAETARAGPRRSSIPSTSDFKDMIRERHENLLLKNKLKG